MSVKTDNLIQASVVYNPFEPSDRTDAFLEHQSGKCLSDYIKGLPADVEWTIVLNGQIVEQAGHALTFPKPGDVIIATVVPEGGGDGKNLLTLVATVALSVVAPIAGAAISASLFKGYTFATALATAAVSVAGGLLISSFIPTPELETPNTAAEEATYGIDGPKNTSTEGLPYPVLYGEHAFGGNIINLRTENATDKDGNSIQHIYGRVVISEGPIESVGQIFVNDQKLETYTDFETDSRLGSGSQTPSTWFEETVSLFSQGREVTTSWQSYSTTNDVDRLRVDMVAPKGVGRFDDRAERHDVTIEMDVEYSPAGQNKWRSFRNVDVWNVRSDESQASSSFKVKGSVVSIWSAFGVDAQKDVTVALQYRRLSSDGVWLDHDEDVTVEIERGETNEFEFTLIDLPEGAYEFRVNETGGNRFVRARIDAVLTSGEATVSIVDNKTSAVRRSFYSLPLKQGKYDIRYRRREEPSDDDRIQDDVVLSDVGEIISENLALPYVAWLGYKAKLTGQLSGIPKVTGIAKGRLLNIYDHKGDLIDVRYSNNPADVALDIYFNQRYGSSTELERIDFAAFSEWRDYCETESLEFNGLFYQGGNVEDALKSVFTVGRAQRVSVGAKVSVAIDRKSNPTMLFSHGNIRKDSFSVTYLPFEDRVNDLEILFNDRNNNFEQRAIRVNDDRALSRGAPLQSASITIKGVTSEEVALREGTFRMNANRFIRRTADWESPIEAVGCTVGDVVIVQSEMMGWGAGGRLLPSTTLSRAKLDHNVTMIAGKQYRLLVLQNSKSLVTDCQVVAQTENLVEISEQVSDENPSAITLSDGKEFAITRRIDAKTFVLEESARDHNLQAEASVTVRRYDVIDDVMVTNTASSGEVEVDEIDLDSPLTIAEDNYPNFIFGEVQYTKKPFRVKSIKRSDDNFVSLSAVEYVPEVYDDNPNRTPHNFSSLINTSHVTDVSIEEVIVSQISSYVSKVRVSWEAPLEGVYAGAEIQASVNGSVFKTVGRTNGMDFTFDADVNDRIHVRVLAIRHDTNDLMPVSSAPSVGLTIAGVLSAPTRPGALKVTAGVASLTATWSAIPDIDLRHYEVYIGDSASKPAENVADPDRLRYVNATSYTENGITDRSDRYFWVRSRDNAFNASDWLGPESGRALQIDFADVAPSAPTGLSLQTSLSEDERSSLLISWDESSDAVYYELAVSIDDGPETVLTTASSPYEIDTRRGVTAKVRVRARSAMGKVSAFSAVESISTTTDDVAPGVPHSLSIIEGFNSLWIEWSAVSDGDLSHYEVCHKKTSPRPAENTTAPVAITQSTSFALTGLGDSDTRYIFVRSVDTSGNKSDWSDGETGTTTLITKTSIGDNEIITQAANIADAVIGDAHISELSAAKLRAGTALTSSLTVDGRALGSMAAVQSHMDDMSRGWQTLFTEPTAGAIRHETNIANTLTGVQSLVFEGGRGAQWSVSDDKIPFDPQKLYKVAFRIKRGTGGGAGSFFLGLIGYGSDKTTMINVNGADTYSSSHYMVIKEKSQSEVSDAGFETYHAYVRGNAPAGSSIVNVEYPNLSTPAKMHAGVRYISPMVIFNYGLGGALGNDMIVDSVTIDAVAEENVGALLNAGSTKVDPGKITIWGGSLDQLPDIRHNGDWTSIDGGFIAANTISAEKIVVGQRNITPIGINFEANAGGVNNRLSWTSGRIRYVGGSDGTFQNVDIPAGQVDYDGWIYVYWREGENQLRTTNQPTIAFQNENLILAQYEGGSKLNTNFGQTYIDGHYVKSYAIEGRHVKAEAIEAQHIKAGSINADKLTVFGSGNLIEDSEFLTGVDRLGVDSTDPATTADTYLFIRKPGDTLAARSGNVLQIHTTDASSGSVNIGLYPASANGQSALGGIAVSEGRWYEFHALISNHRCISELRLHWRRADGSYFASSELTTDPIAGSSTDPLKWRQYRLKAQAPSGAHAATVVVRKYSTTSGSDSNVFVFHPYFGETSQYSTDPAPYAVGGVTNSMSSSNYKRGVSGWAIRSDGSAEFKSLVSRDWLQVGAGSNRFEQSFTTARAFNDLATVAEIYTGRTHSNEVWHVAVEASYRRRRTYSVYEQNPGNDNGSSWKAYAGRTQYRLNIRYKRGGVWSAWEELSRSDYSHSTSGSWKIFGHVDHVVGAYDDVNIRLVCHLDTALMYSQQISDTYYSNADDVSLIAQAVVI